MKKILSSLLVVGLFVPFLVVGDGAFIKVDPYSDRWDYGSQEDQVAYINHEDGLQKMLLSVTIYEDDEDLLWIFPVPATPKETVIDITSETPAFYGQEVGGKAQKAIKDITAPILLSSQIYPIYMLVYNTMLRVEFMDESMDGGSYRGVTVHDKIEKEGMTSELITAENAEALYGYFNERDMEIDERVIPLFENYIGKEFSFIASWVSSPEEIFEEGASSGVQKRGVNMTFPAEKIFYPLLLTSVYDSEIIPVSIRVLGFVTPDLYPSLRGYSRVNYYVASYIDTEGIEGFKKDDSNVNTYTVIDINAPSKYFTEDLIINTGAPMKTKVQYFIAEQTVVFSILVLIIFSVFVSIVTGLIIFKESRRKKGVLKLAKVGLFNCLSLFGFTIASIFMDMGRGNKDIRKIPFVILFSIFFIVLSAIAISIST